MMMTLIHENGKKIRNVEIDLAFFWNVAQILIPQNTYKIEIHLYDVKIWQTIYSNKMSNEK